MRHAMMTGPEVMKKHKLVFQVFILTIIITVTFSNVFHIISILSLTFIIIIINHSFFFVRIATPWRVKF